MREAKLNPNMYNGQDTQADLVTPVNVVSRVAMGVYPTKLYEKIYRMLKQRL